MQQLRTVAIFDGKWQFKVLFAVLDIMATIVIVILRVVLPSKTPDETSSEHYLDDPIELLVTFCPDLLTYILIPLFAIETLTFAMCLYKSFVMYVRMRGVLRSPLLEIIIRNNIVYFVL